MTEATQYVSGIPSLVTDVVCVAFVLSFLCLCVSAYVRTRAT